MVLVTVMTSLYVPILSLDKKKQNGVLQDNNIIPSNYKYQSELKFVSHLLKV